MKHILFIISLMTLLSVRSTAQFVNQGTLFVGAGTTVSTVDNFTNSAGATVTNEGIMSFSANLTNNGNFGSANGEAQLKGSAVQTIGGTAGFTTRTLTVQNTAAGQAIVLGVPVSVTQTANLLDGILKTDAINLLILTDGALALGAGNASHVVGPVQKIGDDIFTFPLGSGTTYRPALIGPTGAASNVYTAQYVETAPTNPANLAACLAAISANEYWQIDHTTGSGTSAVGVAYQNVATSPAIAASPNRRVVRYNGSQWDPISCTANGGISSGMVYSDGVTGGSGNFGVFTLGRALGANITATKTVSGSLTPGSTVTYTISLTNTGVATQPDNAGNEFTDTLPGSLNLVSASSSAGVVNFGGNIVNWNGAIPANGSVTITITATINPGTGGQTISNQGTINFDADTDGTNESTGQTDDPGVVGTSNPTDFTAICPALVATLTSSPSTTITCTQTSLTLTAQGGNSYLFSGPGIVSQTAATGIAVVNAGGVYSVTVTNTTTGCSSTTSLTLTQNNTAPTVSINPSSATLTCASPTVSLSAVGTGTYLWSTGATTQVISVSTANTYSVTVTGTNGCTASTSITVGQNTTPPTVSINPSSATVSCATPTVSLTAVGTGTYRWNTTATTQVISVTTGGTYSVTLTATNGCTASTSVTIGQDNNVPTVTINPSSATLTCTTPTVSLSAVGTGTYRWSTGAITQFISVSTGNTYSVTLTAANSCTASASVVVGQDNSASPVSINPSSATLTCTTSSVSLSAVGTGTYRWSTGATTQAISVSTANTYSVTVTGTNGCTASASAVVDQNTTLPTVVINPTSATLTCASPTVSLSAVGTGTYIWSTGAITQVISVTSAGPYSVTLTGANGCTASASATVTSQQTPPNVTISANPSLILGPGQSTTLTASGANTYVWSTGATTAAIVVTNSGTYSVTGTAVNTCTGTASVTVSNPFAISSVIANTCQQIAANRYVISFTPVYTGTNGQPISFSVVNEVFPTTAPGPYTLQLYTDNPVITLKAQQGGTPGEVTYVYNWLAACTSPQPNTPPRVNQPLTDQVARVGQGFGYTIPQVTFTDNESPQSLVLTVSGLPAGLTFSPPTQIGGVPSVTGVSTVTVTATDPQGLTASTSFVLTVVEQTATNTPPTLANPIPAQVGIQGQAFSLNVATTFTDAQTPNGLTLTASGLPAGLNLVGTVISGTPSMTGTSTVSLTAVDPGGLSATTSFMLTIQPASVTASGPFAITGVSPLTCTQVANNRYEISFQPRYSGVNGQAINFWVVNELVPTTAPGPYSLQLYNDNPTIVLKARQDGSPGETTFSYNWLAACSAPPQPNTAPRVNQPLTNQTARVGQGFGYTIPQITFTDNETPQSLVLTVSGLPAGLTFSPPIQIGGVPSVSGVSSVTVTATDPGGLSVFTTFSLTVVSANTPTGFAITGVQTLSCVSAGANRRTITFTPQYSGVTGEPISFSVVNELLPTTAPPPYSLTLYTDNATLQLRAQQGGSTASYAFNWLAVCNAPTRQGVSEQSIPLRVVVLGNPIAGNHVNLNVTGAEGQRLVISLVNGQGAVVGNRVVDDASAEQSVELSFKGGAGLYLLKVSTAQQQQTLKLIKQ